MRYRLAFLVVVALGVVQAETVFPDLLTFADGRPVKTAADWNRRREEVCAAILPVEYGRLPAAPSKPVEVTRVSVERHPIAFVENSVKGTFEVYRVTTEFEGRPFSFTYRRWGCPDEEKRPVLIYGDGCWQYMTEKVLCHALTRGWTVVEFNRCEIAPDAAEAGSSVLLKWAWMYQRVVDALLMDPRTDPKRVTISGFSRGGKTVLLTAATDTRIACVHDHCSGCGGSAPLRKVQPKGETLSDILAAYSYWFAPEWKTWVGRENELPFDQHFLTSLIAPRGLFIRAAEADLWANPPGTKELADVARSVWKLLGRPNALVYSLRPGPHEYYLDDVRAFLDYCEVLWKADSAVSTSTPKGFTDDYDQALAQAKAEQKLIVADFSGSDWCFWCQRLDEEVFAQESFIAEATNRYVLLMVDRPRDKSRLSEKARKQNPELIKRYKIFGFPTVLLLDADGKVVGETGFVGGGPENFLKHLEEKVEEIPDFLAWIKPLDRRMGDYYKHYSEVMSAAVKAVQAEGPEAVKKTEAATMLRLADELEAILKEEEARQPPEVMVRQRQQRLDVARQSVRQFRETAQKKQR